MQDATETRGETMNDQDLTIAFTVDQTPEEAFAAINNVRGWWSGEIEGSTDKLGDEFTYRYRDVHYSKQKITELIPGKKVVWLVLDAYLGFVEDKAEWKSTRITFEISTNRDKTEVRFTHAGLVPQYECFNACSNAWGFYISGSLRSLITTGKGEPTRKKRGDRDHRSFVGGVRAQTASVCPLAVRRSSRSFPPCQARPKLI